MGNNFIVETADGITDIPTSILFKVRILDVLVKVTLKVITVPVGEGTGYGLSTVTTRFSAGGAVGLALGVNVVVALGTVVALGAVVGDGPVVALGGSVGDGPRVGTGVGV